MITCTALSYTYPSGQVALRNVNLTIPDGAFVLVTGVSGAGKSTLLRAFNGLVPHFYGGKFGGVVVVNDFNTLQVAPRALARLVGFVFQDPETQFVVQTVEDEVAFGMENQGIPPAEMKARIAEVCEMLHIGHLRGRTVTSLSGGEAQRVAIAATLALEPKHLILDEPTSQLDPPTAHALLDVLVDLNRRLGLTIILAEHRLERVLAFASHLLYLEPNALHFGPVRDVLAVSTLRPPIVEAAVRFGWTPIPLSVDEARKAGHRFPPRNTPTVMQPPQQRPAVDAVDAVDAINIHDLTVGYGAVPVFQGFGWKVDQGEIVGLLGTNGAGKSTLMKSILGLLKPQSGVVRLLGQSLTEIARQPRARRRDRRRAEPESLSRVVGYVPQNPNSVLFADTLRDELRFTLRNHGLAGDGLDFLARLGLDGFAGRYPRDLSGGERQRAAIAAMLTAQPPIILLDEPTRGLDYRQKQRLSTLVRGWSTEGKTILIATHDVEWIAGLAKRVTVLADGKIIADGPTAETLLATPGFNTQLGELFGRPDYVSVEHLPDARAETML